MYFLYFCIGHCFYVHLLYCNDLWFIVLGKLPRQYKDFQVTKEDY